MKTNIIKITVNYITTLIISIIISIFFSWLLFGRWYEIIFKPTYTLNLLTIGGALFNNFLGGFLLAYAFFLPIFSFIFVSRKPWLSWLIFIIPLSIFYLSNSQWLLWFIIFTILGTAIGWLIKYVYKKLKK